MNVKKKPHRPSHEGFFLIFFFLLKGLIIHYKIKLTYNNEAGDAITNMLLIVWQYQQTI